MEMNLLLLYAWWHCLPILLIGFALLLLWYGFWIITDMRNYNIERVLRAFLWFLVVCVLVLGFSSYRSDVAFSVRSKIDDIEQQQAAKEQEKLNQKQKEKEEKEQIVSIHEELEEALDIADSEQGAVWNELTKNAVINEEWLAFYRQKINELPKADDQKENYNLRFDNVEAWFYPEGR